MAEAKTIRFYSVPILGSMTTEGGGYRTTKTTYDLSRVSTHTVRISTSQLFSHWMTLTLGPLLGVAFAIGLYVPIGLATGLLSAITGVDFFSSVGFKAVAVIVLLVGLFFGVYGMAFLYTREAIMKAQAASDRKASGDECPTGIKVVEEYLWEPFVAGLRAEEGSRGVERTGEDRGVPR